MELFRALLRRKSRLPLVLRAKINRFNITKFGLFVPRILSNPERLVFRENPYKQGIFARKTHHWQNVTPQPFTLIRLTTGQS